MDERIPRQEEPAMRRSHDPVDPLELFERSDPARRVDLANVSISEALDDVGAAVLASERLRRRRSRSVLTSRRNLVPVAVAIAVIAAGVATAADVLSAHTGIFPSKPDQALGGPGEALNPAAPDIRKVALEVASDIPYPAGYTSWRDFVIDEQVIPDSGEHDPGKFPAGLITTGALRGWFAASAFCAWVQDWRQQTLAGDSTAAAQAAQQIEQAPNWKAVREEDPNPNPAAPNDPGAESGTLFGWMITYRNAVLADNRGHVEQLLATGYGDGKCMLSDPAWMAEEQAHARVWRTLSQSELAAKYKEYLARQPS
jgi:hypothetical protein